MFSSQRRPIDVTPSNFLLFFFYFSKLYFEDADKSVFFEEVIIPDFYINDFTLVRKDTGKSDVGVPERVETRDSISLSIDSTIPDLNIMFT